jgi:phosphopantothenoylcysteine decarboxylase/phosphopantothenate--cysteine ligase
MGHAVATAAHRRGASVTLVTTVERPAPAGVERIQVETAEEMAAAVLDRAERADVVVMTAAVADFRPKAPSEGKLKKRDGVPEIVLEPTPDILAALGARKAPGQVLVGFAAETDDLHANAAAKVATKGVDVMVANDVSAADAGFAVDTNRAILLYPHDRGLPVEETPLLSKDELADVVLDRAVAQRGKEPR